jgi:hypothetical protein
MVEEVPWLGPEDDDEAISERPDLPTRLRPSTSPPAIRGGCFMLVVHVRPTAVTIDLLCNIVFHTTSSRHR